MADKTYCPGCKSALRLPEDLTTARAIKCPRCGERFRPSTPGASVDAPRKARRDETDARPNPSPIKPDEDPDSRPRRRGRPREERFEDDPRPDRKRNKKQPAGSIPILPLVIGSGVGALILLVGVAWATGVFGTRTAPAPPMPAPGVSEAQIAAVVQSPIAPVAQALEPAPVPKQPDAPPALENSAPKEVKTDVTEYTGPPITSVEGGWCEVEVVFNGKTPLRVPGKETWWAFQGGVCTWWNNEGEQLLRMPMRYRLRPDVGPKAIDIETLPATGKGVGPRREWQPGLFDIHGNRMKLCLAHQWKERPTTLGSPPGSNLEYFVLEYIPNWQQGMRRFPAKYAPKLEQPKDDGFRAVETPVQPDPAPLSPRYYDLSAPVPAGVIPFRGGLRGVTLSPDGKNIAAIHHDTLEFFDFDSRRSIGKAAFPLEVTSAHFSPDSKKLLVHGIKKHLRLFSCPEGKEIVQFEHSERSAYVTFTAGGRYVVGFSDVAPLQLWDAGSGKLLRRIEDLVFVRVSASRDGKYLLGTDGKQQHIVDLATLKKVKSLTNATETLGWGAFSADSKLVYAINNGKLSAFDWRTGMEVQSYQAPEGPLNLEPWVSQDGAHLIVQGPRHALLFTTDNLSQPKKVENIQTHFFPPGINLTGLGRSAQQGDPTALRLFCCKDDPALATKAPPPSGPSPRLVLVERTKIPRQRPAITVFSPDSKTLYSFGLVDKAVAIFDVATGARKKSIPSPFLETRSLAATPDGKTLLVSGILRRAPDPRLAPPTFIAAIDVDSGKERRLGADLHGEYTCFRLSPDAARLYAVGSDNSVRAWDLASGRQLQAWERLPDRPKALRLSVDGNRALVVMESGSQVLDLTGAGESVKLPERTPNMHLAPEGDLALNCTFQGVVKVWDTKTGTLAKSIEVNDPDERNLDLAHVSRDGRYVFIQGIHGNLNTLWTAWALETGTQVAHYDLPAPLPAGTDLQDISPDGRLLAVNVPDEVRIFEIPPVPGR